MEDLIIHIRKKAEETLNTKVDDIEKLENVPNNSVYKIWVKNKAYIFKIYKSKTWPEEGKLLFVNNKLIESNIDCAKIILFSRNDPYFQNGFLLEEFLPGENADHIVFNESYGKEFYKNLAVLVSRVHKIPIENYGYIGNGVASYRSLIDFINDEYDERANALINKNLYDKNSLSEMKKILIRKLGLCRSLPSVLCHNDLSTKNVMIDEHGKLTLIDWDDAMSYNWIADLSRMTYWMKFKYNDDEYELYKNTFLEYYSAEGTKNDFWAFENAFHVFIGLDFLNFYAHKPRYEATMAYFKEAIEKLY